MSTLMTFANRQAQVNYMIYQNVVAPDPPVVNALPVDSTLSFKLSTTTAAVITALWNGDPSVPYGYSVTAPRQGTTSYTTDNNGDLESCANLASSQVDSLFGRSASTSRKATVTIPE